MKIAYLIPTVYDMGGTASAVVTQANGLCREHDVEIYSVYRHVDDPHFPLDDRVKVHGLVDLRHERIAVAGLDASTAATLRGRPPLLIDPAWDPQLDALADVALEAALPAVTADVVVTVVPALLALATQLVPPRTAVVHQEHRSSSQRTAGMEPLLLFSRRADAVAMLTEPMAAWLGDQLGDSAPTIVTVPNALPPGFRPRSTLESPVIMAAGRLAAEKQFPQLVSAFARIADQLPEWRLRIFGEGPARFMIMGAVRKLGLHDRVELAGSTPDLASEWARASISALSSLAEGFPLVMQESMAAGVPVVAYDCPSGPRAIVEDGVDGLLVTQGSEAALAAALLRLASDHDERARLGAAALATSASWDSALITRRWVEILSEAVRRRGRGTRTRSPLLLGGRSTPELDHVEAPAGREGAGVTPEQARTEALAAVVAVARDAAASAGVADDWFVVPEHARPMPTVVLPMAARRAFLTGFAAADVPAYLSLHDPEHRGWPSRRGTPAELVPHLLRGRTGRVEVEPWPATGETGSLIGQDCGVAVEFWEEGLEDELHSPVRAAYSQTVPRGVATTTTDIRGTTVPTHPLMLEPTPDDVTFPIDVVYTWVDGDDPAWNDAREQRLLGATDATMRTRASSGRARYLERGELRHSMRSVHLFAPWVRRIHVVTAGQVPDWLDADHPSVNVVDHRDLLPADALPTFSSHAIESVVHRIEGLAEHFLYFNDDFFLGRPTRPQRWFGPTGSAAVFPSSGLVGLPGQDHLPYLKAAANNRRLLQEAFGVTTVHTLLHAPYAHRVSVLQEVAERFADDVDATTRAPFRSATDVSMLSSLGQHYALMSGRAHLDEVDFAFVDITEALVRKRLRDLLVRDREGFCLGDSHDYARDPAAVNEIVAEFFADFFPLRAPWERPD